MILYLPTIGSGGHVKESLDLVEVIPGFLNSNTVMEVSVTFDLQQPVHVSTKTIF
ncbi:MAG TPA: hypothetical protein VIM07_15530 [Chitinophagaceae bacterium]